jgi:putative oxidoreductase
MNQEFFDTWTPRVLSVLRIVVAFLFIQHGSAKLLSIPNLGMNPPLLSMMGVAGILELVGGLLVLLGWFTRPAAFILSGEMAVAYFMAHAPKGNLLAPMLNQGEAAVLFCFAFLFLSVAGPGAWGIDRKPK